MHMFLVTNSSTIRRKGLAKGYTLYDWFRVQGSRFNGTRITQIKTDLHRYR